MHSADVQPDSHVAARQVYNRIQDVGLAAPGSSTRNMRVSRTVVVLLEHDKLVKFCF